MKTFLAFTLLLGASLVASARPVVIEETATITNPNPGAYSRFGRMVATNGEYALVLGSHDDPSDPVTGDLVHRRDALLYRRVAGQWQYQQVLRASSTPTEGYYYPDVLAMKGNLAALQLFGIIEAYRLGSNGWQPAGQLGPYTEDIEIDGERVVLSTGDCSWSAFVQESAGTSGWTSSYLPGQPRDCDDEYWGGPVDIDGDRVILGNANTQDLEDQEVAIFMRSGPGSWYRYGSIVSPFGARGFSGEVVMRGDDAIVDAADGAYVYRFSDLTQAVSRLQPPDAYLQSRISSQRDSKIEKSGDLVFVREHSYDRGSPVINVFRANAGSPGTYDHVAVLSPAGGGHMVDWFDVSGNVVIAGGTEVAYIFELPATLTTPTVRQDDFETGNAAGWTTIAGSQFSVVTSGTNRVYRQSSTVGDARALLGDTSWTNQSIEVQVTPTAFDGNDRWVGLITRYQDAQNFYYVTMRGSGLLQLRRMRAGVFSVVASTAFPVSLNRRYQLRLESIGSVHRVYVDGALLLDADDAGAPHSGVAGLAMYRARADFDNIVVSPSPLSTVFVHDFSSTYPGPWTHTGSGQWSITADTFAQSSITGEARAVIGASTSDQVVEVRVRQIAWSTTGTAERWAGVVARYQDVGNYYYLHLRSGGSVSLRKLVNGTIFTLASAPFAVSLNTQHALRLEVVGNQLRGYVNGNLLLQAVDTSHAAGIGGVMTYKSATRFDDYRAYQP